MNAKLILFIILMVLLLFFIGLNLDNKTDVSLGFYTISQVPVFFPILFSFIVGILFSLPFTLMKKGRNKEKGQNKNAKRQLPLQNQEADIPRDKNI
ncbi:hypothetical protein WKV44_04930 [Spirochaetia bacterium 38H-sp]|uniref:Lipopolysaccharide assembly protein A domain-containing protein n=1 Tax=Rarispira pelagica TaxID=3141764 RepID=A0ABU9UBQ6_9SPIR